MYVCSWRFAPFLPRPRLSLAFCTNIVLRILACPNRVGTTVLTFSGYFWGAQSLSSGCVGQRHKKESPLRSTPLRLGLMTEDVRGHTKRGRVAAVAAAARMRLAGRRKRCEGKRRVGDDVVKNSPPAVVLAPTKQKALFDDWFFFLLFIVKFAAMEELNLNSGGGGGGGVRQLVRAWADLIACCVVCLRVDLGCRAAFSSMRPVWCLLIVVCTASLRCDLDSKLIGKVAWVVRGACASGAGEVRP